MDRTPKTPTTSVSSTSGSMPSDPMASGSMTSPGSLPDRASASTRARRTRRRISLPRLLIVLALVAATVFVAQRIGRSAYREVRREDSSTWFAPYVDVTNTPTYHFEDPLENPAKAVVLSFVVADKDDPCKPSWGAYYGLDEAARAVDLDRRVARFRDRDGSISVSFGGVLNNELAVGCTDVTALKNAYASVVDRYGLDVIDFDIEGAALADAESNDRRAQAVALLQKERASADKPLGVWLTLPAATFGMTKEGAAAVRAMLAAKVELAGVNAMTMNYGASRKSQSMHAANIETLKAVHEQLSREYSAAGVALSSQQAWNRIGATPMIGQNDIEGEKFSVKDAERLRVFAEDHKFGRISMWSLNRDSQCGAQLDGVRVATVCSGIDQKEGAFAFEFAVLKGNLAEDAVPAKRAQSIRDQAGRDDPERSPYPIWRTSKVYEQGNKVVWHHNVYESKWWNQGEAPDAQVKNLWDTPWRFLGPVLDTEQTLITAPSGVYEEWDKAVTYSIGDRVLYKHQAYEARRQSRDQQPSYDPDLPQDTPWVLLDPVSLE